MNWTTTIAGSALLGLVCAACHTDEARDGMVTVELDGLPGLEAHVPAGTKMHDNAVGIGVMLTGPQVSMTVGPALGSDASDLEQAKRNAASYSPTNLEGETLPDGYVLTYESEGATGINYWLVGRRELGDRAYSCGVSSPKKAHQTSAVAICKSLRK